MTTLPALPLPPVEQTTQDFLPLIPYMVDLVVKLNAQTIVETGTDVGDSARIWAMACRYFTGGHVTSVDIKGPKGQWHSPCVDYNVTCVTQDILTFEWARPIDLLFIDDDHTYPHVLRVLERFGPCVRKGGVIALHDVCHEQFRPHIQRSIAEWNATRQWPYQEIAVKHGLGLLQVPP